MPSRSNMTQLFASGSSGSARTIGWPVSKARATARIRSAYSSPTGFIRPAQDRSSSASDATSKLREQLRDRAGAVLVELVDRAAVDRGEDADLLALDRLRPAVLAEAAARALRVRDVDVGALVGEPELDHPLEQPQRLLDALGLVGDVDDLVRSRVDLQGDGRRAHRLLVEPAVGVELKDDVVADAAVQLRVADRPVLAGGEHEVRVADDLDLAAGEGRAGAESALVDDAPALAEEIEGRRLLLLAGKLGDVDGAGEPLEMPRLVGVAEVEEDLAEGVGRLLLEAVACEPDAEVAAARLQQVVEGARGDPGDLRLRRFLAGCCLGDAHRHRSGRSSGCDARHSMSSPAGR